MEGSQITPQFIDNDVINALLEAMYDVLDLDGKRSILQFANREDLLNMRLPVGKTSLEEFIPIMIAMKNLLQFSSNILHAIGQKFSFYLDPQGTDLSQFIEHLNQSISVIRLDLQFISPCDIKVHITATQNVYDLIQNEWMNYFYEGIIREAIWKSVGGTLEINRTVENPSHIIYQIHTQNACS